MIYMEMVQILKEELSNKYRFHEFYMKFHWFHALANLEMVGNLATG